jgi:hypothetical protein
MAFAPVGRTFTILTQTEDLFPPIISGPIPILCANSHSSEPIPTSIFCLVHFQVPLPYPKSPLWVPHSPQQQLGSLTQNPFYPFFNSFVCCFVKHLLTFLAGQFAPIFGYLGIGMNGMNESEVNGREEKDEGFFWCQSGLKWVGEEGKH